MNSIPVGDGYDSNHRVANAVDALRLFGGDELGYEWAKRLLSMWAHYADLAPAERTAVLARFPRDFAEQLDALGNSGPGWPVTS